MTGREETERADDRPDARPEVRLGLTMLVYMVLVIGMITLAPFTFRVPETWTFATEGSGFDILTNGFLFTIPGFVLRLTTGRRRDRYCVLAFVLGLLLSSAVEGGQLFLAGRWTSPIDVVTNAVGCWSGAHLHDGLARLLDRRAPDAAALELPLMGIVYLLVPLLWLHGYASEGHVGRATLAFVPGLLGGTLLAAVWRHRLRDAGVLGPSGVALIAGAWFLVCSITGFRDHAVRLTVCAVGIAVVVRLLLAAPSFLAVSGRRFEGPTLLRVVPLYLVFVLLLSLWPWTGGLDVASFRVSGEYLDFSALPGQAEMLRELEYLAAATLGGYLLAESVGRRRSHVAWALVAIGVLVTGAAIELVRGLHPEHAASVPRFAFAAAAAAFGAAIYRQHLDAVRRLAARPTAAASED